MSLVNYLKKVFTKKQETEIEAPEGFCPNCWGRQEYGGEFYEAVKKRNIDINSIDEQKGWIQDYAEKNLGSIKLHEEDDMLVCNKCKIAYRAS